jgi:4-oxalocrotonate tautomerase
VQSVREGYAARTPRASSETILGALQFVNWPFAERGEITISHAAGRPAAACERNCHATVDIHLIEGVFDKAQKQAMIAKVTDAMVGIEGEAMRGVTWVRVYEVASGEWGIGGKGMTAADIKALREQRT